MLALIADDSPIMRKIIRVNLAKHGIIDVIEAINGADALSIIRNNPSLVFVFLDINMPELSGIALLTYVRKEFLIPQSAFIMISDQLSSENRLLCERLGVRHYIPKPFNLGEFNRIVMPLIDMVRDGRYRGYNLPTPQEVKALFDDTVPNIEVGENGLLLTSGDATIVVSFETIAKHAIITQQ